MMYQKKFKILFAILGCALGLASCSTPYNYEKFRAAKPRSILILPPINQSTDILGTYSFLSTVTLPAAEKGYYIYPVAVIDQMMKENGLPSANEMHQASLKKIREIINPDAVLYLTLEQYGTKFVLIDSQTTVTVSGKLVSAKSGEVIWEGRATSVQSSSSGGGGLAEMLVKAVVHQAVNSSTDYARKVSEQASSELLLTQNQGLLNGPYNSKPNE
jgi:hypothetical protein